VFCIPEKYLSLLEKVKIFDFCIRNILIINAHFFTKNTFYSGLIYTNLNFSKKNYSNCFGNQTIFTKFAPI